MATLGYPLAHNMQLIDLVVGGVTACMFTGDQQRLQDVVDIPRPPVGRKQGYMDR